MTLALALALVLAAAGGNAEPPYIGVSDLSAKIAEFHGRVVDVRGWVGRCEPLSCGLYSSLTAARARGDYRHMLSIGGDAAFDAQAAELRFNQIILRARVNADCRTRFVCTDRASTLQPISIRAVLKRTARAPRSPGE